MIQATDYQLLTTNLAGLLRMFNRHLTDQLSVLLTEFLGEDHVAESGVNEDDDGDVEQEIGSTFDADQVGQAVDDRWENGGQDEQDPDQAPEHEPMARNFLRVVLFGRADEAKDSKEDEEDLEGHIFY